MSLTKAVKFIDESNNVFGIGHVDENLLMTTQDSVESTHNVKMDIMGPGESYTGDYEDVLHYSTMSVMVRVDQPGTLYVQYSIDGNSNDRIFTFPITDVTSGAYYSVTPRARYARISYTNGGVQQNTCRIQAYFHKKTQGASYLPLGSPFKDNSTTLSTKAVIAGRRYDGVYNNVPLTNDDKLRVSNCTFNEDIARGQIPGSKHFLALGVVSGVVNSFVDLWGGGDGYVFPTSAMQMEVVSSSAQDKGTAAPGTGIRTIRIHYLDQYYQEQMEDVTLNGTNAVATVATDMYRINQIHALTVGTNAKAVGTIDIRNATNHTTIYRRIPIGYTSSMDAVYTIPDGYTGYIEHWHFGAGPSASTKSAWVQGRLCATVTPCTYDVTTGIFFPQDTLFTSGGSAEGNFAVPLKVPERADIKISLIADAADTNASAAGRFSGWLETD